MKTVFSNDMAFHVFAQQGQSEGRNAKGSISFEGGRLYSYGRHYVSAFCLHNADGGRAFFYNADSNSVTTNRHVGQARRAIPGRAVSCIALTEWSGYLLDLSTVYDWSRASLDSDAGTRAPWLQDGRNLKSKAELKAALPELQKQLKTPTPRIPFPGEGAAASMLSIFGHATPEKAAATLAAGEARRVQIAAEVEAKAKRDRIATHAKHDATRTPKALREKISGHLGRHSVTSYGIADLRTLSATLLLEMQEAKARGWTRIAANLKTQRATVRAAIASAEKRAGAAYRNRGRIASIRRFREASALIGGHVAKVEAGADWKTTGSPEGLARAYAELAASCADLSRHVPLTEDALRRLAALQDSSRKAAALWQATARAEAFKEEAEARADWLTGGRGVAKDSRGVERRPRLSDNRGGALIRAEGVERDDAGAIIGGKLRTSHGAEVPLPHALRAFRFLKLCRDTGKGWTANGKTLRVGHFRVDSVTPEGDFKAGCHNINWQEVARLAEALGVADLSPENTTEDSRANA
jgi:hypothetical protein